MKNIVVTVWLLCFGLPAVSQGFEWSTGGGYVGVVNSFNGAIDIARDINGNIYVFNDGNRAQVCQGDTVEMLSPQFPTQTFVYKFDSMGVLQWGKAIGKYFNPYAIEVDEAGSVYVLGQTPSDSIKTADTAFACQSAAYYIVKLNAQGKFVWSKFTMPSIFGGGLGINTLTYQSGKIYYQSGALSVSSMDTSGQTLHTLTSPYYSPTTAQPGIMFKNAATFSNGDILLVGQHRGRLTFGTDTLPLTQAEANQNRYFYLRVTPSLQLVWYKSYGSFMPLYRYQIGVTIDPNDNVYSIAPVTFGNRIHFGADSVENFTLVNGTSAFLKMDGNGSPIWIKDVQANSSSFPYGITLADDNSGIYVCGSLGGGDTHFGPFTLKFMDGGKGYIAKLDPDGNFTDAFQSATNASLPNQIQLFPYSLMSTGNGRYYVSGRINSLVPYIQSCVTYTPHQGFFLSQFTGVKDTVAKPAIDFVQEGRKVYFNAILQPGTQFVSWHFGDGNSTTQQQNPAHTYTGAGYFPAVLTTEQDCLTRKDTAYVLYEGVQKIVPNRTANSGYFIGHIQGGFSFTSATVSLLRNGNTILADTAMVRDPGLIDAHFIFRSIDTGYYDVVVTSGSFRDTIYNGLLVELPNNVQPSIKVTGFGLKLWRAAYPEQVVVTNNANSTMIAVPVYISYEGIIPSEVRVQNIIEYDSVSALYRDTLGSEFYLAVDSITGDSSFFGAFYIPIIEPGESKTIFLKSRYQILGRTSIKAYAGKPLFTDAELIDIGLRSSCDFYPVCIQCVHDILGLVPVVGCVAGGVNIACDIRKLVNRGRKDKAGDAIQSLTVSTIGALMSCGGEKALEKAAAATTSAFKTVAATGIILGNSLNDITSAFGSCIGFTPLGSGTTCHPTELADWTTFIVNNLDPNIKNGPVGYTPEHYVNNREYMHYQIQFENVDTAQAPVREVVVRDTLDITKMDVNTLQFTGFGFTDSVYSFFERDTIWAKEIDLRPHKNTILRVVGKINKSNGALEWRFSSYDPASYALTYIVSDGFLDPNVTSPEGEGYVTYMIKPFSGLPHGTVIENKATIYFDYNDPIITPVWVNTIDDVKPQSSVVPLPAIITDTTFTIQWTGVDDHAGIMKYDVYITINDTLSGKLLHNMAGTSYQLTGRYGDTYKFWTVATDRVGNVEDVPTQPDAVVTLQQPVGVPAIAKPVPVLVVPNPASDWITIRLNEATEEASAISITSINGALEMSAILPSGVTEKQLNISLLPTGIHVVAVRNSQQTFVTRIVKK